MTVAAVRPDRPDHAATVRAALDALDVRALLDALGIAKGAKRQPRGAIVCCPVHGERNPSCSVQHTKHGIAWHCFACDAGGDALSLVAAVHGLDVRGRGFRDVLREGARIAGAWDVIADLDGREAAEAERRARPVPPPRRELEPEPARTFPPGAEVWDVWRNARPVTSDAEASELLRSRALEPATVEARDLARVLPPDADVPGWARFRGRSWPSLGYRVIVPVYDASGAIRSVRAWLVSPSHPVTETPKRITPAGHAVGGLVLADPLARAMLLTGAAPDEWPAGAPLDVIVTEGEPDFLTFATRPRAVGAVLGIAGSGSWAPEVADRIPDGSRVAIWTDHDARGEAFAEEVIATLRGRCDVYRSKRADP